MINLLCPVPGGKEGRSGKSIYFISIVTFSMLIFITNSQFIELTRILLSFVFLFKTVSFYWLLSIGWAPIGPLLNSYRKMILVDDRVLLYFIIF